ncbi:unnamed protein product [Coregonus sp. 'balchen']|nr:unnamed protein product [Coregonus sp. 'balchen']
MFIVQVGALLIALVYYGNAQTSIVAVNTTIPGSELSANGLKQRAAVVVPQSPVFHPGLGSQFSLNLLSAFPEDLEVSDYCFELLAIFGQRYSTYVNCLVSAARPVKVCQNCYGTYGNLMEIYKNISSDQMGPGNVSCRDSLLRSDRLMLVFLLYNNLEDIWTASECNRCVSPGHHSLTNDTLYFMATLNQSLSCFEKYQKMNMTRILWSKNFNCSFPRAETVPVIAVSSFMLFLPVIFYLSSFLHSEQKKRKLIHPKRAKSNTSFMNIQDKFS